MNAPAHLSRIKGGEHLAAAYEDIRQYGIREAREGHAKRFELVKRYSETPGMLYSRLWPSLGLSDAIEDATRYIFNFRNLSSWRQELRRGDLARQKENRVLCRYFRRFGKRIWLKEAA